MSEGPLPHRVNIRKAVTRAARYAGTLGPEQLPRFEAVLEPQKPLQVEVVFGEDDEGQSIARVSLEAPVMLECQRCLGLMEKTLSSESTLGLVFDDEQARHLPARYEPWIAVDEVDLWEVAGEELALALPVVSYHSAEECAVPTELASAENGEEQEVLNEDNPFSVLSTLLSGSDEKEK